MFTIRKIRRICFFVLATFSLSVGSAQLPDCAVLSQPTNGAEAVSVSTDLLWNEVEGANGYLVSVGTTSGGNEILADFEVVGATTLDFEEDLPTDQTIYVSIYPYNTTGTNTSCGEITFRTSSEARPDCTDLSFPAHAEINVPLNAELQWLASENAVGYLLTIRTSDGQSEVFNRFDVGNVTNFITPQLMPHTTYFVAIVPYNSIGEAEECGVQSSFTTIDPNEPPVNECPILTTPANGASHVEISTGLEWSPVNGADGYFLSVGSAPNSYDIVNTLDVGNVGNYSFSSPLPEGMTIFVSIVPYSDGLSNDTCQSYSFATLFGSRPEFGEMIPKFFTPNSDGINDEWGIEASSGLDIEKVCVFNRYGLLIKQMSPAQSWDGTYNGKLLPSGSYWYAVRLKDNTQIRGYFALKR